MDANLIKSMTDASMVYETFEYSAAKRIMNEQQAYCQQLDEQVKADKKNKSLMNQRSMARARLSEMQKAINDLPQPKHSASVLAAMILSELVQARMGAINRKAELLLKMAGDGGVCYTLEWSMDALVGAEVEEREISKFFMLLKRVEGPVTLAKVMETWGYLVKDANAEILRMVRRMSSRSSSTQSNFVEDLVSQTKANMYEADRFGSFGTTMAQYYVQNDMVEYDEEKYPLKNLPLE